MRFRRGALDNVLAGCRFSASGLPLEVQQALCVARHLQTRAAQLQTRSEERKLARLQHLIQSPADKAALVRMTDQAFRSTNPRRGVEHLSWVLASAGLPSFLSPAERVLIRGFLLFGPLLPGPAMWAFRRRIQRESRGVILPGQKGPLLRRLSKRTAEGLRTNVNFLGEAILGEPEALRRLQLYCESLQWPEVEVVSIKISTLYSQISALARDHTINVICDRLEELVRTAAGARFRRPDGTEVRKFVYLDMEEYRDMSLTAEAFMRTLDRPPLRGASAGIALQSYLPDSYPVMLTLLGWARKRVAGGGAPITIRLVKGANMEMERLEAALRDWPQAPFKSKRETDANYKRMLLEGLRPENLAAARLGIASHNVFDLAYGLVAAHNAGALNQVQFEMLEGMADAHCRALSELAPNLLLYAPVCGSRQFINAVGYLIRRLDENTGPENFLRHVFQMKTGSPEWNALEKQFIQSVEEIPEVGKEPRRTQNRSLPVEHSGESAYAGWEQFENEPDTDFSLGDNVRWAESIIARWQPLFGERAADIPMVIAGGERLSGDARACADPSRPGVVVGRFWEATEAEARDAVCCAAADPDGWRKSPVAARYDLLGRVALELRRARADLIGAAIADAGKLIPEADTEVSEAVDFVEFYRRTARWWAEKPTLSARPKGVVVVVSPWNFPIAIPCGGVAAALASGNTVLLKPASDSVLVAWELCKCFWSAGISRNVLQFVPASGSKGARALVNDPRVASVILTGGTATALTMLGGNPRLQLFAETGGKNALIVTPVSDREQAIKHLLHSAFSHSGQKCSAVSLLLLHDEIYSDPDFERSLCEAAQSLMVGSAWNLETKIGPLIRPPSGDLKTALKVLEPGERWALKPEVCGENPNLWTPGIKYGTRPGSASHRTEFFGPLLSVMRFETLAEAVALVNQTGYGLTSGLESLDEREWDYWRDNIRAGNLYINRVTTGAVVLRQPFGGRGKSVFGPGMKAGGPNYVTQFMAFSDRNLSPGPEQEATDPRLEELCRHLRTFNHPALSEVLTAVQSYEAAARQEFRIDHDHYKLPGQDNFRRYQPLDAICVRVEPADPPWTVFCRVCAAIAAGSGFEISAEPGILTRELALIRGLSEPIEETADQFSRRIESGGFERIRYASADGLATDVLKAATRAGVTIVSAPVSLEGRLELLWYVREQSLSIDYHRYGNLGARASESRGQVR